MSKSRIWNSLYMIYYRYSVEVGISALERWEAVLVNIYFILLFYSFMTQLIRTAAYLYGVLCSFFLAALHYLPLLKPSFLGLP
jgi:hypothetical protein